MSSLLSICAFCGLLCVLRLYSLHESPSSFVAMSSTYKASSSFAQPDRSASRCCVSVILTRRRSQRNNLRRRPRRVNGTDQTTEPKKTPPSSEEVDEGDVVRVDTQLVSVPAVVTDSSGRPLSGLRRKTFASSKTASRRRSPTSAPPRRRSKSRCCSTLQARHATTWL